MSRKKGKREKKKTRKFHHSTIEQHQQHGKKLIPPFATLPKLVRTSWIDDRLPEMLWAALLISHLPRQDALSIFREVAKCIHKFRDTETLPYDITLTDLSKLKPEILTEILDVITATEEQRDMLLPLLLLKDLPAKDLWKKALGLAPLTNGWETLMVAVAKTLHHQSQESTDCRWARLICLIAAGKLIVPPECAKEYFYYPDYGDMKAVRPKIRAAELTFEVNEREWSQKFWSQCLSDTNCFTLPAISSPLSPIVGTTPEHFRQVYDLLLEHYGQTLSTTAVNPKHDTVFGFAFYCLSLLQELLRIGASQSISARLALRTIVECYITLAYLTKKDDPKLWESYRVFGAGQAKLQYLKIEELDSNPSYVDVETLKALANEDAWEEFLSIDLGHWEKANLRNLSIDANVKDMYDQYYSWTSSFTHGHWGSVRDTVYDTCGNPLHRLHRIPRNSARALPDVVTDVCTLTDKILEILSICYPEFLYRVTVST